MLPLKGGVSLRWSIGLCVAAGCAGDKTTVASGETGNPTTQEPATLQLSFDLDADLIPTMDEPAAGIFKGSIYAEDQASAIGPIDGAVALADFESDPLDFGTAGGALADMATVGPIEPQIVWILGCLDSDGNDCELHDPITVPNENKMQLLPGDGSYTVTMSLLNPSR